MPLPSLSMKLICCSVISSAAPTRSPSFSRSSWSVTMINFPCLKSSIAGCMVLRIGCCFKKVAAMGVGMSCNTEARRDYEPLCVSSTSEGVGIVVYKYPSTRISFPIFLKSMFLSLRALSTWVMPRSPTAAGPCPIIFGEMKKSILSTMPARMASAFRTAPPSIMMLVMSCFPSSFIASLRSIFPRLRLVWMNLTPFSWSAFTFFLFAVLEVMMISLPGSFLTIFAFSLIFSFESMTILIGFSPRVNRTVSSGLSFFTVLLPTITASRSDLSS